MTDRDFPRLSSASLLARFGGDEAALRRYRMLTALLREGRSAVEVARTFGVSRESLRRACQAFDRDGLDGLRSRKRGGGHLVRGSALALVLQQELANDPAIPAAGLWRRVQARMAEMEIEVPRSSFYRLLTQLRGERVTTPPSTLDGPIREALTALAEDPPLDLGRGALASLLLPEVRDPLARGRWLQRALRNAIERLRPSEAGPVLDGARWRHYLIIAGEYEAGDTRAELQQVLALSASTYSRAKREAIERLAALLPIVVDDLPPPAPPAASFSPPPPSERTEHELELERYAARLRRDGLIVIHGPDGVGKTALVATLAARLQARGQKIVWHSARPPEAEYNPGHSLLLTLASALNLDGLPDLWTQMSNPEPAPFVRWLHLLNVGLVDRHWTVMIDNAHRLVGSQAARVIDLLREARDRRDLRLVLVTRELPRWVEASEWPELPHPDDAPARRALLAQFDAYDGTSLALEDPRLRLINERVRELLTTLGGDLDMLSEQQRAALRTALDPVNRIAQSLDERSSS